MRKIMLGTCMLGTLILLSCGMTVHANDSGSAQSTSDVVLTPVDQNDQPPILDPQMNDENGVVTGGKGDFTLDLVPNFNFGEKSLSQAGKEIMLEKTKKAAVQVSDRRSTGAGWSLQVKLSSFKNIDGSVGESARFLRGAELRAEILNVQTSEYNKSEAPVSSTVTLQASDDGAGEASQDTLWNASAGSGMGSWLGYFADGQTDTKTSLKFADGNYAGTYSADLTWILMSTPD